MIVLAGKYKGMKIKSASMIRPLTTRIKKSLFDILKEKVVNSSILDLFAGSGSFSIEAISRGAKHAILVEKDRNACKIINENLKTIDKSLFIVINSDVKKIIPKLVKDKKKFDIIFIDPPFNTNLKKDILFQIPLLLNENGWIIIRCFKKNKIDDRIDKIECFREKNYGDSLIRFYK